MIFFKWTFVVELQRKITMDISIKKGEVGPICLFDLPLLKFLYFYPSHLKKSIMSIQILLIQGMTLRFSF